jgi:hypothetical protein
MAGSSKPEDWEVYPQNLRRVPFHNHEYDLQSYSNQLQNDSARLFVGPTDPINLKTIYIGGKGKPRIGATAPAHWLTKRSERSHDREEITTRRLPAS